MEKTPVSMLQEIMMKLGSIPIYEEIHKFQVPKVSSFTIRVRCKEWQATGTGANKKAAKHNAAQEMLKLLVDANTIQTTPAESSSHIVNPSPKSNMGSSCVPINPIQLYKEICKVHPVTPIKEVKCDIATVLKVDTPLRVSMTQEPFINYVGKLKEYCEVRQIADPVYTILDSSSQAHCCTFTARCTAVSRTEEATARTKKLAKQAAAKGIIEYIVQNIGPIAADTNGEIVTEVYLEKFKVEIMSLKISEPLITEAKENAVYDRYKQITNRPITPKNIKIGDYHEVLKELCCRSLEAKKENLAKFCQLKSFYHYRVNEIKEAIHTSWNVKLEKIRFRINDSKQCIVGFRLDTRPAMMEVAVGDTCDIAEMNALLKLLKLFFTFMK